MRPQRGDAETQRAEVPGPTSALRLTQRVPQGPAASCEVREGGGQWLPAWKARAAPSKCPAWTVTTGTRRRNVGNDVTGGT